MTLRQVGFFFLTVFVVSLMAGRLIDLQGRIEARDGSDPTAEAPGVSEDRKLFNDLLAAGLLTPLADGRLHLPDSDFFLCSEERDGPLDSTTLNRRRLLKNLYYTPVGRVIRNQVRLWNESRYLAAVRDDRAVETGEAATHWRAVEPGNSRWAFPRTGSRVPVDFGYVNQGIMKPGFTDWLAAYTEDRAVVFRTEVQTEGSDELTVQVIG